MTTDLTTPAQVPAPTAEGWRADWAYLRAHGHDRLRTLPPGPRRLAHRIIAVEAVLIFPPAVLIGWSWLIFPGH